MKMVLITPDELGEIIRTNVREALAEQTQSASPSSKPLTIDEAAKYLGIPKNTLYQLTSNREIPHQKIGRRLKFLTHQLDEWIAGKRKKTRSEIESEVMISKKGGRWS